jgi:hypothetical protein
MVNVDTGDSRNKEKIIPAVVFHMVNVYTGDSRNKEKIIPAVVFHMVNVDTGDSRNKENINRTLYINALKENMLLLI